MPDRNVEALLAYLRQNSGRFTLEALELQMHAAGHAPATVREALDRFLAREGAKPPPDPSDPMAATGTYARPRIALPSGRRPVWGAAVGIAAFDLVLAGAGAGLLKAGEGKVAFLGGCVVLLAPLALLLELLVGLILTAADGSSRPGRAMLYGSLLVLGLAALTLVAVGIYLAATGK